MNTNPPESNFDRWWWRAWYVFVAVALAWLVWCAWLSRPAAPWTQGWVGWWTGDQMGSRPLWNFFNTFPAEGSEIVAANGNPVFRTGNGSFVGLGYWGEEEERWTWAGWVRTISYEGAWPVGFLAVRTAQSPSFGLRLGFESGHPRAMLSIQSPGTNGMPSESIGLRGGQAVPSGQWVHLAFSADRGLQRLLVNGVPVTEARGYLGKSISLARLRLTSNVYDAGTQDIRSEFCELEQDDVVVFDRVVPPEELAALAARGRGAWARELERPGRAARVWGFGWPLALLALAGMVVLKLSLVARHWLKHSMATLVQPSYRTVRWTVAIGLAISVLIAGALARQSRRADEQHFDELLNALKQDSDVYWETVAGLLLRTKDWIATQTNLNQSAWEDWLKANHFPHDYTGVVGVGYAEQVQPEELSAHEALWSARHHFAYTMHPSPAEERHPVRELGGQPHLPVVLYSPRGLDRRLWFTNHTILGTDLLFQSPDDRREWAQARRIETAVARHEITPSSMEEIAPASWYGDTIRGLRLYVPWTLRTKTNDLEALEASAWRGVVFASVDVRAPLSGRVEQGKSPLGFRLFTGDAGGERFDLVTDTADFLPETAERHDAYFRRTLDIPLYRRRLWLDVWTSTAFEAQSLRRWPWIVGVAGGVFTLLAASLLVVQIRAREAQAWVLEALRVANSELLNAYREREHLSRDLHDGSIQNLYGLGLHLQRVQTLLAASPERARAELNDSLAMLDQSIAELRQFILTAGVDQMPQHTVTSTLESLVERLRKTTLVNLQLHLDQQGAALDPRTGVQVLHIVREAVSNTLRHAKARHIEVRLERIRAATGGQPEHWRLSVVDDGHGFDVKQMNGHGHGLKNLAARATELGGRYETQSTAGAGTRVVVEFPG